MSSTRRARTSRIREVLPRAAMPTGACLLAVVGAGCSLVFPATPPTLRDGGTDASEGEGVLIAEGEGEGVLVGEGEGEGVLVGEGEGEGAATLEIVDVDGDGSAHVLAPTSPLDVTGVAGAHRVASRLRVEYVGAPALDAARLTFDQLDHSLSIENTENGVSFLSLPASVPARTVLPLTLVAGALTAHADVFVLQGEPGPPGPAGADGLVTDRAATSGECPFGGRTTLFGTDGNGDRALTGLEVASTRVDCDDVVQGPHAIAVANETELRATLASLEQVRIAPSALVAIDLPAGDLAMTDALFVTHRDGERILLRGAATGSTLQFPDDKNGLIVLGGLRLQRVSLRSPATTLTGVGLLVQQAGFLVVDVSSPPVTVSGFGAGVEAFEGGVIASAENSMIAEGNDLGFYVNAGGTMDVPRAIARNNAGVGYQADAGTLIARFSSSSANGRAGYLAQFGGVLDALGSTATELGPAFMATHNAHVLCANATANAPTAAQALEGGDVLCSDAILNGAAVVSTSAQGNFTNTFGSGFAVTVNALSSVTHTCKLDPAPQAACAAVVCTADATSQCIGDFAAPTGGGGGGGGGN